MKQLNQYPHNRGKQTSGHARANAKDPHPSSVLSRCNPFIAAPAGRLLALVFIGLALIVLLSPLTFSGSFLPLVAVCGLLSGLLRIHAGFSIVHAHPVFNMILALITLGLSLYALFAKDVQIAFSANILTAVGLSFAVDRVHVFKALKMKGERFWPSAIMAGLYWFGAVLLSFFATSSGTPEMIISFCGCYLLTIGTLIILSIHVFGDYTVGAPSH